MLLFVMIMVLWVPSVKALIACHDGRMPCQPKAEYLELAGEEYDFHLHMAFGLDETRAVFGSESSFIQDTVIELIKVIRNFEVYNLDLLWEKVELQLEVELLRRENQRLRKKYEPDCFGFGGAIFC